MAQANPFISFLAPQGQSRPDALLGFALPVLPTSKAAGATMQTHLINALWGCGAAALELRFVTTASAPGVMIYLLCRIRHTPHTDKRYFLDHCTNIARNIEQLFKDYGYQLQPITNEAALTHILMPFQIQALAEVRRNEKLLILQDAYTEYEAYAVYPWEWNTEGPLSAFAILSQQRNPYLISTYLEPTELYSQEQAHLSHAVSSQVRNLLEGGSIQGQLLCNIYEDFAQKIHQPYLLRICAAASSQQALAHLGRSLLSQLRSPQMAPVLQFPQNEQQWQIAIHNLRSLAGIRWGDLRNDNPATARLRYLVDSQGASMGFCLPVAPEPAPVETQKIKVLLIFANPYYARSPLRLGTEDRVIHEAIKLSRYRDNILLAVRHAATIHDLSRALLEDDFQIVHIAGHGVNDGMNEELVLEDEKGEPYFVPPQALANLFQAYNKTLRCVLLNACYSLSQGQLITLGVPFTIAMEGPLGDHAAYEFARGFYDAIGAGKEIGFSYQEGCRRVDLAAPDATFAAKLLVRD